MMPYEPMLCEIGSVAELKEMSHPEQWIVEQKFDGMRCIAQRENGAIHLWTRRGLDASSKFPELVADLQSQLPQSDWVVDGEITVLGGFESLLRRNTLDKFRIQLQARNNPATLWVFDVLQIGQLRFVGNASLKDRKAILESDFIMHEGGKIHPVIYEKGDLAYQIYNGLIGLGLEGVVIKRLSSVYQPAKRSLDWLKVKRFDTVDVEVIGATKSDAGLPFGALIVARDGKYYGKVGSGFTDKERMEISTTLKQYASHLRGGQTYQLPSEVAQEVLITCAPILAEIKVTQEMKTGAPRHPVWVRFKVA